MPQRVPGESPDVSLVAPLTAMLRRWRILVSVPTALAVIGIGYAAFTRGYAAVSTFVPEASGGQAAPLAGLALQLGFMLGGAEPVISVDFYRNLLQSRTLVTEAILTRYRFAAVEGSRDTLDGNLIELLDVGGRSPTERLRRAQRRLARRVVVGIDRAANVVTLRTTAPWPALAEQINRRLLELVNTFNIERRNSSAAARRDFTAQRLEEADAARKVAEAELRRFLDRNRRYQDSPELVFEAGRLQQELELRQQVYTTLAQAHEQARIDAVRDTPVITMVESPEGSARPATGLRRYGLLGLVLGAVLSVGVVVVSEYVARHRRERPEEYRELDRVWQETIGRLKRSRRRASAGADSAGPA